MGLSKAGMKLRVGAGNDEKVLVIADFHYFFHQSIVCKPMINNSLYQRKLSHIT